MSARDPIVEGRSVAGRLHHDTTTELLFAFEWLLGWYRDDHGWHRRGCWKCDALAAHLDHIEAALAAEGDAVFELEAAA